MNFLAHLLLSGNDEHVMVGNFIGDFVKGSQIKNYHSNIQYGIRLHRSIDQFTDTHPVVTKSKKRLRAKFRHYSPVIVDVFYDHFVARDWNKFSPTPLLDYTLQFYSTIEKYSESIPRTVVSMLQYMKAANWLYNYQFIEGINKALVGMARRTKFDSKMEEAAESLTTHYDAFGEEFHQFIPDLFQHVKDFEK